MSAELDIVSILVVAASENQAEILNALLRAHGIAVRPAWVNTLPEWRTRRESGLDPEVVFYFADRDDPPLADVIEEAAKEAVPVIVVAREPDASESARALDAGAADWVTTDEGDRMAAVLRRERARRAAARRLLELERDAAQDRARLHGLIAESQDAIATVHDGVVVEANPAWAARFGHSDAAALAGTPIMDLFAPESQKALKHALRAASRQRGASGETLTLVTRDPDGNERPAAVEFAAVTHHGQELLEVTLKGEASSDEIQSRLHELEEENLRLQEEIGQIGRCEAGRNVLRPAEFAPLASEHLSRPASGALRALVAFRPADAGDARRLFGPLGMAQAGTDLSRTLAPLLEPGDLATRVNDMSLLALIERPSAEAVEQWAKTVLGALHEHIFEAGARSGHLAFVAGYSRPERLRRLDTLCRQALEAAQGTAGSVGRAATQQTAGTVEHKDSEWSTFIPEAFRERRFMIALQPVEDLAKGIKHYVASPRLLDRDGKEIGPESFYAPAERCGLLDNLERRLVGYALVAEMHLQRNGETGRMLVPLSGGAMGDAVLPALLSSLAKHPMAREVAGNLVLELALDEVTDSVRDAERFGREIARLGCGLGLREFVPNGPVNRLIDDLPLATLRLAPEITAGLAENSELAGWVHESAARASARKTTVIASAVSDANTMALLYNLGVGTIEGPVIGEPRLFSPAAAEENMIGELG